MRELDDSEKEEFIGELLHDIEVFSKNNIKLDFDEFTRKSLIFFSKAFLLITGNDIRQFTKRAVEALETTLYEMPDGNQGLYISKNKVNQKRSKFVINYVREYGNFKHLFMFSPNGFSKHALAIIAESNPVEIETFDIQRLQFWISNFHNNTSKYDPEKDELQLAVRDFSRNIIRLISNDISYLQKVEWRDMERLIAEAFESLGFEVELTSASKDGGRDVIVKCFVYGEAKKYVIEVKHWKTKVGKGIVNDFVQVVMDDVGADKGIILATSGFSANAFEELTEVQQKKVIGRDAKHIETICRTFVKHSSGLMTPIPEMTRRFFNQ